MMKALVTGAGGMIGGQVAKRLQSRGACVVGVSRRGGPLKHCDHSYQLCFGDSLATVLQEHRVDVILHCAHDVAAAGDANLSEQGTLQWARESQQAGIGKQIFLSSISARPDARAPYGQTKYRLERWFLSEGGSIFRFGLVIGMGGLFGRMARVLQKSPIVPLIDNGRSRVYFNGLDFVCDQIAALAWDWQPGVERNLQQPEPVAMRSLLESLREVLGVRTRFLPVPYYPCLAAAWVLERLRIKGLGITYDNVAGLRQNDAEGLTSDFLALGGEVQDVRTLIERAIKVAKDG